MMKEYRLACVTTHDGADIVADIMISAGCEGIKIDDRADVEDVINGKSFWDYIDENVTSAVNSCDVTVFGYVENGSPSDVLSEVRERLDRLKSEDFGIDFGPLELKMDESEKVDWFNNWKKFYSVMEVGEFLICPEWESVSRDDKKVIKINPGTAFGTGEHDSTRLCLTLLSEAELSNDSAVIDIGAGSGILAIAALLKGAGSAHLTDIDPDTLGNARENAKLNGVEDRCTFACADLVRGKSGDVVFANITADVLIRLSTTLDGVVKKDGTLIMSGIINSRLAEVKSAFESAGFRLVKKLNSGEWNALMLKWK